MANNMDSFSAQWIKFVEKSAENSWRQHVVIQEQESILTRPLAMLLPKNKGAEIWDLDGNKYLDFSSNGVGACS